jgi:hypothetical protein
MTKNSVIDETYTDPCDICHEAIPYDELGAPLQHFIDNHPDSDQLRRALDGVDVENECKGCQKQFVSDLTVSPRASATVTADAYCPSCVEADALCDAVSTSLDAQDIFDKRVDKPGDAKQSPFMPPGSDVTVRPIIATAHYHEDWAEPWRTYNVPSAYGTFKSSEDTRKAILGVGRFDAGTNIKRVEDFDKFIKVVESAAKQINWYTTPEEFNQRVLENA